MDYKKNLHRALLKLYKQYLRKDVRQPYQGICGNVCDILLLEMKISHKDMTECLVYMLNKLFPEYPDRAKSTYGTYYQGYVVDGPDEPEETYWENPKRIKLLKWLIEQTKE